MASDNLMAMEQPWMFRPTFADSWITDIFKENDTLTKALHNSISTTTSSDAETLDSLFLKPQIAVPLQTPTASGGSENDAAVNKQRRSIPPSCRVTKRKSRASKRATTTFITADPANFRQMVQQVTGVRCGALTAQVLKPEPQMAISRIRPTLDTSAFFLEGSAASLVVPPDPSAEMGGGGGGAGIEMDSFCSFPTLESWKVV